MFVNRNVKSLKNVKSVKSVKTVNNTKHHKRNKKRTSNIKKTAIKHMRGGSANSDVVVSSILTNKILKDLIIKETEQMIIIKYKGLNINCIIGKNKLKLGSKLQDFDTIVSNYDACIILKYNLSELGLINYLVISIKPC